MGVTDSKERADWWKQLIQNKECEIDGCVEEAHNKVGGIVQDNNQDMDKIIEVDLCDKHFLEQCEALK